ncbi:hypothetical protein H5410_015773 [Solanum commersonii]|uniref:Reverse transcriptase domain-containing protein n=1 Tax=Solanum commersonii TaxID=4109 RepID=A0A9J5ZUE9_SOLCO|nr:hypothetical protein H5410_015773 [Solanum commersonii]
MEMGLHLGSTLSPFLFALVMNELMYGDKLWKLKRSSVKVRIDTQNFSKRDRFKYLGSIT